MKEGFLEGVRPEGSRADQRKRVGGGKRDPGLGTTQPWRWVTYGAQGPGRAHCGWGSREGGRERRWEQDAMARPGRARPQEAVSQGLAQSCGE